MSMFTPRLIISLAIATLLPIQWRLPPSAFSSSPPLWESLQAQNPTPAPSWQPGTITLLTIGAAQSGHSKPVRSVAFSPEGQFFASGSGDRTIKIWNLTARQLERTLPPSADEVNTVAFSPNGQLLASGALDGIVKVWDWRQGNLLQTFPRHADIVTSVVFSPDGQQVISASGDATIKVWDINSGTLQREIKTEQWITALALNPDGERLASSGLRSVQLWDWTNGKLAQTFADPTRAVYAVALSPDGEMIAYSPDSSSIGGSEFNTIHLKVLRRNRTAQILRGHEDYVASVAFSPDSQTLISGSWDKTVKIWNVETGEIIRSFSENSERILSVAFNPNGRSFIIGSGDGTIKVWESTE